MEGYAKAFFIGAVTDATGDSIDKAVATTIASSNSTSSMVESLTVIGSKSRFFMPGLYS